MSHQPREARASACLSGRDRRSCHTWKARIDSDDVEIEVVVNVSEGVGPEALAASINGEHDRPDGSIYRMTWSLDKAKGPCAIESNDLLQEDGLIALSHPISKQLRPSIFEHAQRRQH